MSFFLMYFTRSLRGVKAVTFSSMVMGTAELDSMTAAVVIRRPSAAGKAHSDVWVGSANGLRVYRIGQDLSVDMLIPPDGTSSVAINAMAACDLNNDQYIDIYIATNGVDIIFQGTSHTGFSSIPSSQFREASGITRSVSCADWDNDGFQDIYIATDGGNALLINQATETAQPIVLADETSTYGAASVSSASKFALFADINSDVYTGKVDGELQHVGNIGADILDVKTLGAIYAFDRAKKGDISDVYTLPSYTAAIDDVCIVDLDSMLSCSC